MSDPHCSKPAVDRSIRVWGVIPAAGVSRRLGRPKQTLPYRGSTFLASVTRTVLEAGLSGVVVVTRTELVARARLPDDPRVRLTINDCADSEMIDSVRIGLATLSDWQPGADDGVLVMPGDMPAVTADSCRACAAAYIADPGKLVIATYKSKRGHPLVFPFALREVIAGLEGGLAGLPGVCAQDPHLVELGDAGVILNVNTEQDYQRLRHRSETG